MCFFPTGRSIRLVHLHLEPNDRLIGDDFVWQIRDDSVTFKEKSPRRCHYMHRTHDGGRGDGVTAAAFTYCPGSSKVSIRFILVECILLHTYIYIHTSYSRTNEFSRENIIYGVTQVFYLLCTIIS